MVATPVGTLDGTLDSVWWAGSNATASELVPNPYMVSINGRTYLEDLEFKPWKRQAFRATTTTTTRTQADTSNEPGEQSLSTESLWRRTQDSWHLGAGQVFLDRKNSQEFSYRSSLGINPWTQWQLSLHHVTNPELVSGNTNMFLAVAGSHIYVLDGTLLKYTDSSFSSWTTVTGTPAVTANSICSDGFNVWVCYGPDGIYHTTEAAGAATQYISDAISSSAVIRFVMGRLMLGTGNVVYNLTASGTLATAGNTKLGTSLYGNLVWTDFAAGNGVIFASGNSGDVGVIYSIQINSDGAALSAPIVCGQLPNGENVTAIYGYAGSGLAIGSSLGFRFAEQSLANGVAGTVALTMGPLFPLPNPVKCFSGYSRFIWGGYTNYDSANTGLFRMDPTQFVSDLAPAYASDVMALNKQGVVVSLVHFNGLPTFGVSGVGVFQEDPDFYVVNGTIDSGLITYGLADPKMPVFVDDQIEPLPALASVQTLVSLDGGTFTPIGSIVNTGATFAEFSTPQQLSQTLEIRQVLNSDTASNLLTPVLTRHTFRAAPAPPVPTDWTIVIQLRERVTSRDIERPMKPSEEYQYLDGLRQNKVINTIQVSTLPAFVATIESIDYIPEQRAGPTGELNGVAVLTCRTVV